MMRVGYTEQAYERFLEAPVVVVVGVLWLAA